MRTRQKGAVDATLLVLALAATAVGLVAIFSAGILGARKIGGLPEDFVKQAMFAVAAPLIGCMVAQFTSPRIRALAPWIALASVVGVALTFTPLGVEINSQRLWIKLGPVQLQPAEFLKVAALLLMGAGLAMRGEPPVPKGRIRSFSDSLAYSFIPRVAYMWPLILGFILSGIVVLQQDLATAFVILVMMVGMHAASGAPLAWTGGILASLALVALLGIAMGGYRQARIVNWISRWEPEVRNDRGFQQVRSEIGLAKGGVLGVGLANGEEKKHLPVQTSDFILTTVGEELGAAGVVAIIALLAAISLRLFMLAAKADAYGSIVLSGIALWIAAHTVVNVCMVNATLPAIGLPLPFVSYGGSSLIALWAAIGFAMAISREKAQPKAEPAEEAWREARSDRRRHGRSRLSRA